MAVNFGILQPIQNDAKPLMGSAPGASAGSVRQTDNLEDFANGFLSSFSKGQQIANQAEQLKQNKIQTEAGEINLNQLKESVQDKETLKAAAQQGIDSFREAQYKLNPVAGVEFDTKIANMQENQAKVKTADAEAWKHLNEVQAKFYGNVAGGRDDKERQMIWNMQYKDLPDSAKKQVPEQYSPNDFAAGMLSNQMAIAEMAPKKPEPRSTVGKLQDDAAIKRDEIARLQARGIDTTQQEQELKTLEMAENNQAKGTNTFQQANQLRDEVNTQAKPFREVNDSYGRIQAAFEKPSAAGDIAGVFNFMKMLDPGSVVREGEFATAQNAAGVPQRIRNMFNKLQNGERLSAEQRADFQAQANRLYKSQEKSYQQIVDDYTARAKRAGLDPKDVIVDVRVKGRDKSEQAKPSNQNFTDEDIAYTAQKHGLTPEQVRQRLGAN